jgi:hypothetical protein
MRYHTKQEHITFQVGEFSKNAMVFKLTLLVFLV